MMNVILETDKLIDVLNSTDFVKNMISLRKKIIDENITISIDNKIVREYISNQNLEYIQYHEKYVQMYQENHGSKVRVKEQCSVLLVLAVQAITDRNHQVLA